MPRPGRAWFVAGAYATLFAIVGVGLLYGDRLDRRVAGVAGPPVWLLLPFGLLLVLAGGHTLVEHRRVGAAVDDYNAAPPNARPRGEGVVLAVAAGIFLAGIGATLALVGLFFGIVGLVQTLR